MVSAVETFIGNLRRSLSGISVRPQDGASLIFRVTGVREPFVGKHIGDCSVIERIGAGAMSVVYKAKQDVTDRIVAVKMMRAQLAVDPKNVKRFQREAKAISRLSHPNLLNVYHVGTAPTGQPFIVMDFVEGRSLADVIEAEGAFPWQRAMTIFMQVCDAMEHAHSHGVIHRDLKPDNIMLIHNKAGADLVKVVDFGIVKLTDESQALSQKLTATGEVWGSPTYMSPEQCNGKPLDARSDIYSLGTVMYEALTGRQLFTGKRITDIIMKQLMGMPDPFKTVRPDLDMPPWVEQIVFKTLEKDPINRFQSMADVKSEIERSLRGPQAPAAAASTPQAAIPQPKPVDASAAYAASVGGSAAVCETGTKEKPSVTVSKPRDEWVGATIGDKYVIKSFIGEGGMSIVYKAVQQGVNRTVAVKMLREELLKEDTYVKRFEREAKSLSGLSHPNLVSLYDLGVASTGQPYMVIEYLEGTSLHDWVIEHGAMPLEQALPLMIQVCDVMDYAHKQGVVHRDIKPHNIMLVKKAGREETVKVVDFGIVKLNEQMHTISQKLTATGEICGSPMYMSPEQILDEPLDGRTDIYSLGVVIYELITGRTLFGGKKITEVMNKHVNLPAPTPSNVRPDLGIPPKLDEIVRKALEKRAANRYQSMAQVKDALTEVYNTRAQWMSAGGAGTKPSSAQGWVDVPAQAGAAPSGKPTPTQQKNMAPLIVAVAVAALLIGVGGALLFAKMSGSGAPAAHTKTAVHKEAATAAETAKTGSHVRTAVHHKKHHAANEENLYKEAAREMDATEDAYLKHNNGSQSDPYNGMPKQ